MNYHYMDGRGQEVGPVSLDNLKTFRTANVITDATLIRPDNGGPWTPFSTVASPTPQAVPPLPPGDAAPTPKAVVAMENALSSANEGFRLLASNPVANLPSAYQRLGPVRAAAAGVTFLVVALVVWMLCVYMRDVGPWNRPHTFGGFIKLLLACAIALAVFPAILNVVRLAVRRGGSWQRDLFVAGAMSILRAIGILAGSIVGWQNAQLCQAVTLLIVCVIVLQFFVALTRMTTMEERWAALLVPVLTAGGLWLADTLFSAIDTPEQVLFPGF